MPPDPPSPPPPPTPANRWMRREQAALDALRTLVRDFYADQFGVQVPEQKDLELALRLRLSPGRNWAVEFTPALADQLRETMADYQAGWDVYRAGRVYCFHCDSSACEHSRPPSPLAVFRGYAANGTAEWSDLAQALLALRDDRVDRLFARPSDTLARVQLGHELRADQLSSFGRASRTYAVLGQVIAGYFARPEAGPADPRLALTFQVVETRAAGGRLRLALNIAGGGLAKEEIEDLLAAPRWEPVARARDGAARRLERLERDAQLARAGGRAEDFQRLMRQVPALLRHLAESLERGHRQGARRTRHVEARRHEQRPVHKALDDARAAAPEAVFFDEKTRAYVVRGPQGRAHVFNAEGRHVTSFALGDDAVALRLRTHRWRPLGDAEQAAFRALNLAPGAASRPPA